MQFNLTVTDKLMPIYGTISHVSQSDNLFNELSYLTSFVALEFIILIEPCLCCREC